jgi:hypothetical protein
MAASQTVHPGASRPQPAAWDSTGTVLVDSLGRPRPHTPLNISSLQCIEQFLPLQSKVISAQVTGAATAAVNTSIGTSGVTQYGRSAWRLTTEAVNGSTAGVRVVQSTYSRYRNLGTLDLTKPLIVLVYPHAISSGSRLIVHFSATNVATGSTRFTFDQYITAIRTSGETLPSVVPITLNARNGYPFGTGITGVEFLQSMEIQAYQEGVSGITDITVLGVYQASARPMVNINFDDGFKSVYDNAFPIMEARGLKGTINLTGSLNSTGTRAVYENLPMLTRSETDELLAAGWEICVHGTIAIAAGSYAATLARVQGYRDDVIALGPGYAESSMFFTYPGGALDNNLDVDGQPIGFKALKAAGFVHAARTGGGRWSDALSGLGDTGDFSTTLAVNYLNAPRTTMYEGSDIAVAALNFYQSLMEISSGGGYQEFFTHSVVPRTFINGGQPHVGENPAWTGVMATNNDISTELFTEYMDMLAMWRDLGLLDVVKKRDWWAGVPGGGVARADVRKTWMP